MPARRLADHVKTARGTLRSRKPPAAGAALTAVPRPPKSLSPAAAAEWRQLAAVLVPLGTLTEADLRGLALLAETLASVSELAEVVRCEGTTISGPSGAPKAHPALQALAQARAQAARLLDSFGLTPRARASVDRAPGAGGAGEDPAAGYFL